MNKKLEKQFDDIWNSGVKFPEFYELLKSFIDEHFVEKEEIDTNPLYKAEARKRLENHG